MVSADSIEQQVSERIEQSPENGLPMALQIAEALLQRAKSEPEPVAEKLRKRAQGQLLSETAVSDNKASASERNGILEGLAALVSSLNQAAQQAPSESLSSFDQQMLAQNTRLLGGEQAPATEVAQESQGLRAAKRFSRSRQRRAKRKTVEFALQRRPEDPGPLNPEMLAVKVLGELQSVSTAYLDRYVSFVEALVTLEVSVKKIKRD